jgi:hypothetical protein
MIAAGDPSTMGSGDAFYQLHADPLYQLHSSGLIWRYMGTECDGESCPGWQRLDNHSSTADVAAGEGQLFQRHNDGGIWRYRGDAVQRLVVPRLAAARQQSGDEADRGGRWLMTCRDRAYKRRRRASHHRDRDRLSRRRVKVAELRDECWVELLDASPFDVPRTTLLARRKYCSIQVFTSSPIEESRFVISSVARSWAAGSARGSRSPTPSLCSG